MAAFVCQVEAQKPKQLHPPAADGSKVLLTDTDHLWERGGNYHAFSCIRSSRFHDRLFELSALGFPHDSILSRGRWQSDMID